MLCFWTVQVSGKFGLSQEGWLLLALCALSFSASLWIVWQQATRLNVKLWPTNSKVWKKRFTGLREKLGRLSQSLSRNSSTENLFHLYRREPNSDRKIRIMRKVGIAVAVAGLIILMGSNLRAG